MCTYLTGLSYTGCGHCSELCGLRSEGGKKKEQNDQKKNEKNYEKLLDCPQRPHSSM